MDFEETGRLVERQVLIHSLSNCSPDSQKKLSANSNQ